jgi:hypothetical protein
MREKKRIVWNEHRVKLVAANSLGNETPDSLALASLTHLISIMQQGSR